MKTFRQPAIALGAIFAGLQIACSGESNAPAGPTTNEIQLVFATQPGNVIAGEVFAPVRVEFRDIAGNVVVTAGGGVAITLGSNTAGLSGTVSANAVNGVATFNDLAITHTGSGYRLRASSGTLTSESVPFDVAPGPVERLVFVQGPPATVEGNVAIGPPVRVSLRDAYGNPVDGSVTLSLEPATPPVARLAGTLSAASADGIATFADLRVDRPRRGNVLRAASGNVSATSAPFAVRLSFLAVSAGGRNANYDGLSCGRAVGGTYCWGANNDGQLGSPGAHFFETVPALVAAPVAFAQVTAGGMHACGRTAGGAVYCWGLGTSGQLGDGRNVSSNAPVLVSGSGAGSRAFESIDAGLSHTCGIVNGTQVYCWGANTYGALGNGSTSSSSVPTKVTGSGAGALQFARVSAGNDFTCGVATGYAVWCWGVGFEGQLGGASASSALPGKVTGSGSGGLVFDNVSAGMAHACAVTAPPHAGRIYCWGSNLYGGLGDGSSGGVSNVPVSAGTAHTFTAVAAATNFSCALSTAGHVFCWGRNFDGELGIGTLVNVSTPVSVMAQPGSTFGSLSADGVHACAVATAGDLYCWGLNSEGRLGDGTTVTRLVPTRIAQ